MANATISVAMDDHFPCPMVKTGTMTFDGGNYVSGGIAVGLTQWLREIYEVIVFPVSGYNLVYNKSTGKVMIYSHTDMSAAAYSAASKVVAVTHDDAPGGNRVYLKFDEGGPYLCSNLATETANKQILFGASGAKYGLTLKYDASAAVGSIAVTFDNDGTQPSRLISDLSGSLASDVYVPMSDGLHFLKIENAGSGGVNLYYDDDTHDRFECNNAGGVDADLDCAVLAYAGAAVGELGVVAVSLACGFVAYGRPAA